jgi:charged multivesicular body protein 5
MKKIFGAKKNKDPPPSIQDATDRVCQSNPLLNCVLCFSFLRQGLISSLAPPDQISKRGDTVDEKIKKLDAELARYKEQIKKTRPGPAQEAVKARAMRVLKQRRM